MMLPMNKKLNKVIANTTDEEKIRLFYELGKYFLNETANEQIEDKDMQTLYDDIANVVQDIENL